MVEHNALPALNAVLTQSDKKILTVTLEGIENFLKNGKTHFLDELGENKFAIMLEICGGVDRIERLQTHKNHEVNERSLRILETYYAEAVKVID